MGERVVQHSLCRMCDDRCAINVYLEDGRIVDIDGYEGHPWNEGRLCVKGRAAVDMIYHPDRLMKPLKKGPDGFEEIPLEQALDEIAEKLLSIKEQYGPRSISAWKGEAIGFAQQENMVRRWLHAFGTPNYFSNDSECFNGRYFGYTLVEGVWPVPDYERSDCVVIWGANPPHAHPNMTRMIMEAKKRGGKLIVVDPRLSAIARQAHIHAQLMPGTDGALALGIINGLIRNNFHNVDFIEKYTVRFRELAEYVRDFTPEYVEKETAVPREVLDEIVHALGKSAPRAAIYLGNGPEHHENGINNIRAVACIDAILGLLDQPGGNVIAEGMDKNILTLYDEIPLKHMEPIGEERFPVLYDLRQECHTMTAMNTLLSGEPYPLKAMILAAANPVMTNPNSRKVKEALASLDLFVVRDLFMTETAELADYVLPAASFLERNEIHYHAKFQRVTLARKIVSFPDCQDEYSFWHDLAHRTGIGDYFPWKDEKELVEWIIKPAGITFRQLEEHPEGIEYKPVRYKKWKENSFNTPSGKIEFTSEYLSRLGYPALPEYTSPAYRRDPSREYPYVLVTGARKLLYYHSRFFNIPRFADAIPSPEVEVHPEDAESMGLQTGDRVRITSRIGAITIPVAVKASNEIVPGVFQITHGWKDANINLITHDDRFDPISGFPLLKAVEVSCEKV